MGWGFGARPSSRCSPSRMPPGLGPPDSGWLSYGSLLNAKDDAPRAAAVICDPANDLMRVVGTGRARELWVLYPFRDERVVCRGAVLSYYEFDAKDTPADVEWKAMLDSKDPPPEPPWITGP